MEVLVKYCREDPWAGLDLLRGAIHRTPMRGGMRGNAAVSFGVTPAGADGPLDAAPQRARRALVLDLRRALRDRQLRPPGADRQGVRLRGGRLRLLHHSPVHTDEYLAAKAAEIAAVPELDGILFYDTAGVLDVERMRVLLPQIVAAAGGKQVEFHSNNLMGTSGLAYVEAVKLGSRPAHRRRADVERAVGAVHRERRPQPRADGLTRTRSTPSCWRRWTSTSAGSARRPATWWTRSASTTSSTSPTRCRRDARHAARAARAARDDPPHPRGAGRDRRGARATSAGR